MRMKLALATLAIAACTMLARADTVTVDVSATSCPQCPQQFAAVNLNAVLTVELVTGTFFDSGFAYAFTGQVYEVVSLTGTLNGSDRG